MYKTLFRTKCECALSHLPVLMALISSVIGYGESVTLQSANGPRESHTKPHHFCQNQSPHSHGRSSVLYSETWNNWFYALLTYSACSRELIVAWRSNFGRYGSWKVSVVLSL